MSLKKIPQLFFLPVLTLICWNLVSAQGAWKPVINVAPDTSGGLMILLSDGTVLVKSNAGGTDLAGNKWNRLTPDINGSYVNGTWSAVAPMNFTRVYFSSQLLRDGRLYVAGGEYGAGGSSAEIYDPLTDSWTLTSNPPFGIGDANSELLPDGRVLQAFVGGFGSTATAIFDPATNTFTNNVPALGSHDESAWLKLPDNSILYINQASGKSERYIPDLNQWVKDDSLPFAMYDPYYETGPAFLLPDGRGLFFGGAGNTAYYTPSGTSSPGKWSAGPVIPKNLAAPDAAAAMLPNGKILCTLSPVAGFENFTSPTFFYEFNYLTNSFTQVNAPDGSDSADVPAFITSMLNLPDGSVLFSYEDSTRYFVYVPDGAPVAAGKPVIDTINSFSCDSFRITGTLFNGISVGSAYGDDWQMSTNYPIVRLTSSKGVYYARTFNWNQNAVQSSSADTAEFTLPPMIPEDTYALQVTVNGISSDTVTFTTCMTTGTRSQIAGADKIYIYPNPTSGPVNILFNSYEIGKCNLKLIDMLGNTIKNESFELIAGGNSHVIATAGIAKGMYLINVEKGNKVFKSKVLIE